MSYVSINPNNLNDEHYRYKRPLIVTRFDKSNKTYLENINQICSAIFRDKKLFYGYLKIILNTQVNIKKIGFLEKMSNCSIENHINDFVNNYVLCGSCSNPETELKKKKSKDYLYLKCKACGLRTTVINNKITEKLYKII